MAATKFSVSQAGRSDILAVHTFLNLPFRPVSMEDVKSRIGAGMAFVARDVKNHIVGFGYGKTAPMVVNSSEAALDEHIDGFAVKRALDAKVNALLDAKRTAEE